MSEHHSAEYSVRIPRVIKKHLFEILKRCSPEIKFNEVSSLFENRCNRKLELLFLGHNEIIIQEELHRGWSIYGNEEILGDAESEEDMMALKYHLKKIDFTEFSCRPKKFLASNKILPSNQYLEIKMGYPGFNNVSKEDSKVRRETKIQNMFDVWHFKVEDIMPIFIANIFDPSKFWLRLSPIENFESHLKEFYEMNKKSLAVELADICIGLNCVALISNIYYRARIVRTDIRDQHIVKVFLYDYGTLFKVTLSDIYHLEKSFYKTPAFAVRAILTNISSLDHMMWSQNVVDRFVELTNDKILIAKIAHIHKERKIIEIHLLDTSCQTEGKIATINYCLVKNGLAKFNNQPLNNVSDKDSEFKPRRELLYLFPSFETIENGSVPSKVNLTEQLQQCVPLDIIFTDLYEYQPKPE